jgi:hypothetical protein
MQRLSKAVAHAAIVLALSCFSLSQSYSIRDLGTLGGRGVANLMGLMTEVRSAESLPRLQPPMRSCGPSLAVCKTWER